MPSRVVKRLNIPEHARPDRIICAFDGLAEAADPGRLLDLCRALWARFSVNVAAKPDYLFGLDSGGIVPTVGIAIITGLPYRLAYKLDLELPAKITICEPFAARPYVFAYNLAVGQTAVLVDDEVFTGETACNAITALRAAGVTVLAMICLSEVTSKGAREKIETLGVPLFSGSTLEVEG